MARRCKKLQEQEASRFHIRHTHQGAGKQERGQDGRDQLPVRQQEAEVEKDGSVVDQGGYS